jgi:hypothetical protein
MLLALAMLLAQLCDKAKIVCVDIEAGATVPSLLYAVMPGEVGRCTAAAFGMPLHWQRLYRSIWKPTQGFQALGALAWFSCH